MQNCYNTGERIPREKKIEVDDRLATKHIQTLQFVQEVVNENKVLKNRVEELELSTSNCDELHALAEDSKNKIKTIQEQYLKRADEINAMMAEKHRDEVRQSCKGTENNHVKETGKNRSVFERVNELDSMCDGKYRRKVRFIRVRTNKGIVTRCKRDNDWDNVIGLITKDINVPVDYMLGKVKETANKFDVKHEEKRNEKMGNKLGSAKSTIPRRNRKGKYREDKGIINEQSTMNTPYLHIDNAERKDSNELANQFKTARAKQTSTDREMTSENSMRKGYIKDIVNRINNNLSVESSGKVRIDKAGTIVVAQRNIGRFDRKSDDSTQILKDNVSADECRIHNEKQDNSVNIQQLREVFEKPKVKKAKKCMHMEEVFEKPDLETLKKCLQAGGDVTVTNKADTNKTVVPDRGKVDIKGSIVCRNTPKHVKDDIWAENKNEMYGIERTNKWTALADKKESRQQSNCTDFKNVLSEKLVSKLDNSADRFKNLEKEDKSTHISEHMFVNHIPRRSDNEMATSKKAKLCREAALKSKVHVLNDIVSEINKCRKHRDEENSDVLGEATPENSVIKSDEVALEPFLSENQFASIGKRSSANISRPRSMEFVGNSLAKLNSSVFNNVKNPTQIHNSDMFKEISAAGASEKGSSGRDITGLKASVISNDRNNIHSNSSILRRSSGYEMKNNVGGNGIQSSGEEREAILNESTFNADECAATPIVSELSENIEHTQLQLGHEDIEYGVENNPGRCSAEEICAFIEQRKRQNSSDEINPGRCSAEEICAFIEHRKEQNSADGIDGESEDIPVRCSADAISAFIEHRPQNSFSDKSMSIQ